MYVCGSCSSSSSSFLLTFFFFLFVFSYSDRWERKRGPEERERVKEKYVIRPLCGFFSLRSSRLFIFLSDQVFLLLIFFFVSMGSLHFGRHSRISKCSLCYDSRKETFHCKQDFYGLTFYQFEVILFQFPRPFFLVPFRIFRFYTWWASKINEKKMKGFFLPLDDNGLFFLH